MRKFLITSLLIFACGKISACVPEAPTHNRYMFSVFHRNMMNDAFTERINAKWIDYTHGTANESDVEELNSISSKSFNTSTNKIITYARKHGDREMLTYLRLLTNYLEVCKTTSDPWNYPSKREMLKLKARMLNINQQARLYNGTQLKSRYALLIMRTYFLLGNHTACSTYWKSKASKLTESVFKDKMRDLYAGTLVHTSHVQEACDIYASLNDMQSIKWCMRKNRNLAGIKTLYLTNANSPALPYLVQDFVNNAQETIDDANNNDSEWFTMIDVNPVYRNEVMQFIRFSETVNEEGKTKNPCLWQTAAAFLNYLFGNQNVAVQQIEEAQVMAGTERMKDNARAIKLLISAKSAKNTPAFSKYLLTEMKWLEQKVNEDNKNNDIYFDNHYTDVIDRIVYSSLIPKFKSWGEESVSTALLGMMSNKLSGYLSQYSSDWNNDYSNDYFEHLDTMKTTSLIDYFQYVKSKPADEFQRWIISKLNVSEDYFNDLIGTKYMRTCNFEEAAKYLSKVTFTFIDKQNISAYMTRDYTVERWMRHQKIDDSNPTNKKKMTSNPKLKFCYDMANMESQYAYLSNDQERQQKAYDLAVRYFQASYLGDCWYLTRYGQSVMDSCRVNEIDFAKRAINYLDISKSSQDFSLKEKSLYALAYIPFEPWGGYYDDYEKKYDTSHINTASQQYHSLIELALFCKDNQNLDRYITHCDVLNKFIKMAKK